MNTGCDNIGQKCRVYARAGMYAMYIHAQAYAYVGMPVYTAAYIQASAFAYVCVACVKFQQTLWQHCLVAMRDSNEVLLASCSAQKGAV